MAWSAQTPPSGKETGEEQTRNFQQYKREDLLRLQAAYKSAAQESEARLRRHDEKTPVRPSSASGLAGRVATFEAQSSRSSERRALQAEWAGDTASLAQIERELALRDHPLDRWTLSLRKLMN
ncbi:MAG: hypothetical protein P8M78_03940 [Myxococcota bacterium]|nr:hypothetical protein [Myxococcota bacterium]